MSRLKYNQPAPINAKQFRYASDNVINVHPIELWYVKQYVSFVVAICYLLL